MAPHGDWFRRTSWTPADPAAFMSRLGRSRKPFHKAQYPRIQALHLAREARPPLHGAALALLDLLLRDDPEASQLAAAHQQRAECLAALDRRIEALEELRLALEADRAVPPWPT